MLRKFAVVVLAATLASGAAWAAPELRAGHPQSYTVQRGDTLWDIAGRFLVQPWRWPEIWRANPQVRNPDLIYPGDTLVLTYVDGEPVISVGPGEEYLGGRSFKRSPTAREEAHEQAVATIPLDIIRPFLTRPLLKSKAELELAPYVLASADQHLLAGTGDRIYARGELDPAVTRYTLYREGPAYRRGGEDKAEILGYEALEVGEAVLERAGDPATLRLTRSTREVREGDRLFPQTDEQYPDFLPRAPGAAVEGNVISVMDAVSRVGQYQVVVLDLGAADGIEPGHVLSVFQANQTARDTVGARQRAAAREPIRFERADSNAFDAIMSNLYTDVRNTKRDVDEFFGVESGLEVETITLPEEHSGELMVFRTFDQVSYALVMRVARPVHMRDRVRNP